MHIGIVSTRLAGVDGVTFEATKWEMALERMGHQVRMCSGAVDALRTSARLVPPMHFAWPPAARVTEAAFDPDSDPAAVRGEISRLADLLVPVLDHWIDAERIELLIVENAWAIPMHLPLGVALRRIVERRQMPGHRPPPRLLVGAQPLRELRRAGRAGRGLSAGPADHPPRQHQLARRRRAATPARHRVDGGAQRLRLRAAAAAPHPASCAPDARRAGHGRARPAGRAADAGGAAQGHRAGDRPGRAAVGPGVGPAHHLPAGDEGLDYLLELERQAEPPRSGCGMPPTVSSRTWRASRWVRPTPSTTPTWRPT